VLIAKYIIFATCFTLNGNAGHLGSLGVGLAGTSDSMTQIRDIPGSLGWEATLEPHSTVSCRILIVKNGNENPAGVMSSRTLIFTTKVGKGGPKIRRPSRIIQACAQLFEPNFFLVCKKLHYPQW